MKRDGSWGSVSPSKETCLRCASRVAWYCFAGNLFLTFYKIIVGYLGGSPALMADGLHSFTDVIGTTVILWSTRVSARPPDARQPYGYGKVEFMSSIFIYAMLIVLAILIFGGGLVILVGHHYHAPHLVTFFGGAVSILQNVILYRLGQCAGKRTNSPALLANSFENRADAISSAAVCIGILAAITIHPAADPIAAMAVGVIIFVNCIHEGRKAIGGLMDESPSKHVLDKIRAFVSGLEEVEEVPFLRVRPLGTGYWIDVGLSIAPGTTARRGQEIADRVRQALKERSDQIDTIEVFVVPAKAT